VVRLSLVLGWGGSGFGGIRGRGEEFEVVAVVDLLDDGKAWELDEVDVAERKFEEDSAGGSAVENADLLPCCVDHDWESLGLEGDNSESPESVIILVTEERVTPNSGEPAGRAGSWEPGAQLRAPVEALVGTGGSDGRLGTGLHRKRG
jgi:hypothetical protein